MNVTAVETLERRLAATRDALNGELDRARNARTQAEKAEQRAGEHRQVIRDLELALEEIRGWAPTPDPLASGGEPLDSIHATRGAPS